MFKNSIGFAPISCMMHPKDYLILRQDNPEDPAARREHCRQGENKDLIAIPDCEQSPSICR
jgi:hypothetical protein